MNVKISGAASEDATAHRANFYIYYYIYKRRQQSAVNEGSHPVQAFVVFCFSMSCFHSFFSSAD